MAFAPPNQAGQAEFTAVIPLTFLSLPQYPRLPLYRCSTLDVKPLWVCASERRRVDPGMRQVITVPLQQVAGRTAQVSYCARQTWILVNAMVAVVAGISTLNMVVANLGMATINEFASPIVQQFARIGREA